MFGTIALDIDGTITADSRNHTMTPRMVKYLSELVGRGWKIVFITGRSFQASHKILRQLTFPYYLAVQNGASIIEMPSRQVIAKKYLDRSIFETMENICLDEPTDFIIYAGIEYEDVCYYRPKHFSPKMLTYLQQRIACFKETWHSIESFDEMALDSFASVKCFGHYDSACVLKSKIENSLGLHVPLIRDPFDEAYYVVQATHAQINKGQALQDLLTIVGWTGKIIAAGDDLNDIPMLACADIKIAMATAPNELLLMADIIAPPASEEGLILGLEQAINQ